VIRVLIVDDHPAMRSGLMNVLRREPGLVPVGAVGTIAEAWTLYNLAKPDVVLLDFHIPGESSLRLAQKLKRLVPSPRVLLHSAHAGPTLALAGVLAQVDGVLSKSASAAELSGTLRRIAQGQKLVGDADELRDAAAAVLDADDRPIATMLLEGATPRQVRDALGLEPEVLKGRLDHMLDRLGREAELTV
jgi:DNA-binding NarL/FixJ family response regulator